MAQAQAQGADTIVTHGAMQSNHARQTAAAAAKLGLGCHILLEEGSGVAEPNYALSGNALLNRLHGAHVSKFAHSADISAEIACLADQLIQDGKTP